MRKLYKKTLRDKDENSQQKINQDKQLFQKVTNNFTQLPMRVSQHNRIASMIREQIRRPQTSTTLRKDYKSLLNLVDCNGMIIESRQRSIMSYNKMKNLINDNKRKSYEPLYAEIQNTQSKLCRKKHKKYDIAEFSKYLESKSVKEGSLQEFVQNTLLQGVQEIKALIPIEARLHKKLIILGELIEQQKKKHVEELKQILLKEKKKSGVLSKNFQIYLINHYLIQKLMMKTFQDSSAINIKNQNSEVYSLIRREMIGQLIKERKFSQIITIMQEHEEQINKLHSPKDTHSKLMNKSRLKKSQPARNHRYQSQAYDQLPIKNKQNQITVQFEKVYRMAQEKLTEAQLQFNFPTNRKQNFHSMIEMKGNYQD